MHNKYIYEDIVLFISVVPVKRKKSLYFIELLKNVVWLNHKNSEYCFSANYKSFRELLISVIKYTRKCT